jgi:hypothetical protein
LNRSNKTSIHLQDSSCDPLNVLNLLKSLKKYVLNLRNSNLVYENKVIVLVQKSIVFTMMKEEEHKKKCVAR